VRRWGVGPVLDIAEELLEELSRFDSGSFSYRYPVEKDGKTSSHPERNPNDPNKPFGLINLRHFAEVGHRLRHRRPPARACKLDRANKDRLAGKELLGERSIAWSGKFSAIPLFQFAGSRRARAGYYPPR